MDSEIPNLPSFSYSLHSVFAEFLHDYWLVLLLVVAWLVYEVSRSGLRRKGARFARAATPSDFLTAPIMIATLQVVRELTSAFFSLYEDLGPAAVAGFTWLTSAAGFVMIASTVALGVGASVVDRRIFGDRFAVSLTLGLPALISLANLAALLFFLWAVSNVAIEVG